MAEPDRQRYGRACVDVLIVAEHGYDAVVREEHRSDPHVRSKIGGRWRNGTAETLPDDDPLGPGWTVIGHRVNAAMVRDDRGPNLLTVRAHAGLIATAVATTGAPHLIGAYGARRTTLARVDIRDLSDADAEVISTLSHLFDGPAEAQASRRFGEDRNHHLLVAYVDDTPAGFISGVAMTHPDKGTEMFIYELAVDEPFRRRGIGTALATPSPTRPERLGCFGMWVATDADNEAALGTYKAGGSAEPEHHVVLTWTFDEPD